MVWFIIAIILLLIGVGMIAVALANGGDGATLGFVPIVVAGLLMIPACLYSQDAGEVVVLKNMGGSIAGYSADAGFHGKLPWQSTVKYDTRNNVISYVAKGKEDKQKALNEQEVEKTKAETKRIKAQGEADANKVLNDSLTDNVLRQHYIDALQNADQLIVTPEGSNTLIQPK